MSGVIQVMMMRKSAGGGGTYSFTGWAELLDDNGSLTATLTAYFNTNGTLTFGASTGDSGGLSTSGITHWHNGGTVTGIGNSRWAKRTQVDGDIMTSSISTTTPTALSTNHTMEIKLVGGETRAGTYLVEVYSDSGGVTKVGQVTLTMTVYP